MSGFSAVSPAKLSAAEVELKAVSDQNDAVLKVLSRHESGALGVCAAADQVMEILQASGHVKDQMAINPSLVGIDPCNRAGEGVNSMEVGLLASEIAAVGWSWAETSHAICVAVKPSCTVVEQINASWVAGNDGLAPVEEGSIKFSSLSCGHTNAGLRAIAASAKSDCLLLAKDGRYNMAHIANRDPEFARAVREGLRWRVLDWKVRVLYPQVLDLIQRARNANSNVLRRENEMAGLLQLHALSASCPQPVDWQVVKKVVLKTNPPFADKVDNMVAFVVTLSGGQQGLFLQQLAIFFRQFVNPSKRVGIPSLVYLALSEFPHHFLALGLLKTCWTCPVKYAEGKAACEWIGANELFALGKNADPKTVARLRAAEACLRDARALLLGSGVLAEPHVDNKLCTVLTKLDCQMGRFVLKRQDPSKVFFRSVQDVADAFVANLHAAFPEMTPATFVGAGFGSGDVRDEKVHDKQAGLAPKALPDLCLYELDSTGKAISAMAVMRKAGFDLGMRVVLDVSASSPVPAAASASASGPTPAEEAASDAAFSLNSPKLLPQPLPAAASSLNLPMLPPPPPTDVALSTKTTEVYKIVNVANEQVHLLSVFSQVAKAMSVTAFVASARISSDGEVIQNHPGWPEKRAMSAAYGQEVLMKCHALFALELLVDLLRDGSECSVDVREQPSRQVIANTLIPPGALTLLPETLSVRLVKESDRSSWLGMKPFGPIEAQFTPSRLEGVCCLLEPRYSRDDCCPFWYVTPTEDAALANVALTDYRVQCIGGADSVKATRRKVGKKAGEGEKKQGEVAVDDEDVVMQKCCVFPVLINTVAIPSGTPLRIFWTPPPAEKKKARVAPITVGQIQKRARV